MTENEDKKQANPQYAIDQLAKALLATGEGSLKKMKQWQDVLAGMLGGNLDIGSRTPIKNVPSWVTPEVIFGGFATGKYAAGGELLPFEKARYAEWGAEPASVDQVRMPLNGYYIAEEGRAELIQMLKSRLYRVNVPEESMLLVVAWLFEKGEIERGMNLIDEMIAFCSHLRFYPIPATHPLRELKGDIIFVHNVFYAVNNLRRKAEQESVLKMNEAIQVWMPLYDRAVSLFLETVDGDIPSLETDESGALKRKENGQPIASGGWPCKKFSADWSARAKALLNDYESACKDYVKCTKHKKKKENFARLRGYLEIASRNPNELTERDIGYIRKILASYVTAHGAPDSESHNQTREMQSHIANLPLHHKLAQLLADRLANQAPEQGIADFEPFIGPITKDESKKWGGVAGGDIPPSLIRKAYLCKEAPIAQLIEERYLRSSEALASQLSLLTSRLRASRSNDPELAQILQATYLAFRKRRSLLLLNLQSQVKFEELPWVKAVEPWIKGSDDSKEAALKSLNLVTRLVFRYFPQTILPNKLVKEMRALAKDVDLKIPLVDELAADIFMGEFTVNYLNAAKEAAHLLKGTLYERYYEIDFDKILIMETPEFAQMCNNRLSLEQSKMSFVAINGAIIEQAQILTTHNLASLWSALDLDYLRPELPAIAQKIFGWICLRQQMQISDFRANLHRKKDCAYAFRQMIFFLSLAGVAEQKEFLKWMSSYLKEKSFKLPWDFDEILQSFADCVNGGKPEFIYLGWSSDA
ncbi:hypothetical protein KA183_14465 [bacterium]|nr:hypothetical protein [bacterium]